MNRDVSRRGLQDAGHDLQEGTFSGSVLADDTKRLATFDLETDIAQCPELGVALDAARRQQLPQAIAGRVVDRIALGDILKLNGIHG